MSLQERDYKYHKQRIGSILKEFERLKLSLPSDLKDEIPFIAELICDMMVYPHLKHDRMQQIDFMLKTYFVEQT